MLSIDACKYSHESSWHWCSGQVVIVQHHEHVEQGPNLATSLGSPTHVQDVLKFIHFLGNNHEKKNKTKPNKNIYLEWTEMSFWGLWALKYAIFL